VAGYAVHQGQQVFRELADRMVQHPQLRVKMYLNIDRKYGDSSAPAELLRAFSHRFRSALWPSKQPLPEVYYDERSVAVDQSKCVVLHAKCVVVDSRDLFVSSANFTEAAQKRNIEVGLLLRSPAMAARLVRFFEHLVEAGVLKRLL
jgi:phosphatidylserine/phosphatidylglycerophosphate/cardiolipin synthase-like enzyme